MFGFLNKALGAAAKPLGSVLRGKLTVTGIAATVAAAAVGKVAPQIITSENIVALVQAAAAFVGALATLVAAFGFGRKAAS